MVISVYVGGMYVDVENLAQTGSAFMAYMPLYIGEMWDVGGVGCTDVESGKSSRIRNYVLVGVNAELRFVNAVTAGGSVKFLPAV